MVFRLYGKISPHPCEIPSLVGWDLAIPVVLRSSRKHKGFYGKMESRLSGLGLAGEVLSLSNIKVDHLQRTCRMGLERL